MQKIGNTSEKNRIKIKMKKNIVQNAKFITANVEYTVSSTNISLGLHDKKQEISNNCA